MKMKHLMMTVNRFLIRKKPTSLKPTKRARKVGDSDAGSIKCRPIRRSLNKDESVEVIMMIFDSLRCCILQLNEKEDASRRADLKADTLMMQNGLRINGSPN
jgi:[histone H3]-lysine9 N-dimethyltransferase